MTLGKTFAEKQRERKGDAYDYVVAKLKRRIADLEADNKRLREVLKRIVDSVSTGPSGDVCQTSDFEAARAALKGNET